MSAQPATRAKIQDAAVRLFAEHGATEINVSELALLAGVSRGTIYKNVEHPEALFGEVALELAHEMHARVVASMVGVEDPAQRLANGMRMFVRRAHEENHWGRFMVRFALNDDALRKTMDEPPTIDIAHGIRTGRYKIDETRLRSIVSMVAGTGIAAMQAVLDGQQTWREAGAHAAELVLRCLGINADEALAIASTDLPPLAKSPR